MSDSTASNIPGGWYAAQETLNPFQILCLPPNDPLLSLHAVCKHIPLVVGHVYVDPVEGGSAGTTGYWVPTSQQVNEAVHALDDNFDALRIRFRNATQYYWNPFASIGSREALLP